MSIAMSVANGQTRFQSQSEEEPRSRLLPNGRLRVEGLDSHDRNWSMAMHLSPLAAFFIPIAIFAPLVMWLIRKDESEFSDDHGKEVVNFLISFVVIQILLVLAAITIIGIPVTIVGLPVVWIVGLVSVIRGAVAASRGEYFRYPMTIRFLS